MIFNLILIVPLLVVINGETNGDTNCSLYNYCGSHGYCYNVSGDQWFCDCKFWWEGRLCNQQSKSGQQVIILGSLTGFLILIFFGLKIGRMIYIKKKNAKQNEIEEISDEPNLPIISLDHMKKSIPLTSYIIAILTILVAVGTLVAKWALLDSIHKVIVKQYINQDELIYYNRSSFCDIVDLEDFDVFTFPFACLLVILCIIVTKRLSFMKNICYGYGATPMPLDFLSHIDRGFAAVIFAIIADDLLGIVQQMVSGTADKSNGILVTFILRILNVLYMALRYFPILTAVYINSIFILACATIYAWLIYAFTLVEQNMCYPDYYPSYNDALDYPDEIIRKLSYYGTGSALLAIQICADIPRYLCFAYVSIKLPAMLIEKIYDYRKKGLSDEKKILVPLRREEIILLHISHPDSVEWLYVKNLFRSPDQRPRSRALFARIIPKLIYEWRDDFRFSSRILCIYSSIFLLIFLVIIWASIEYVPYIRSVENDIETSLNSIVHSLLYDDNGLNESTFPLPDLVHPFLLGMAVTATIIVIQLLVLLANIRRNLMQAFRGDASEIPRRERDQYVSYATGNFHFAGYFIGYLVWGFIILATLTTVIFASIGAFIQYGSVRVIEQILKAIIPSILLVTFKIFLNKLLAQYVFLQDCGEVLALNNRRALMIFIYFNFFLDAFLGFLSSIVRFIKSIIALVIYMCRLDYSALGRKLENFDSGFGAYCGFIHTECTHRHPVMLVFASYLFNQIKKEEYILNKVHLNDSPIQEKDLIQERKSLRYIRKWRLAAFLVRNPTVIFFRKAFLKQLSAANRRALNDTGNNNNKYNIQRGIILYAHQRVSQQPNIVSEYDPPDVLCQRL